MINLTNKVTVITGGSRGVGAACAELFAEAGADVVFNYLKNSVAAETVTRNIEKKGRMCLTVQGDIANKSVAKMLIEKAISIFGKIDILINNVGIWTSLEIGQTPEFDFAAKLDELIKVNLNSFFYTTHYATPYLQANGGGRIINISSTAGQRGEAHHSHYAASKGGIISMTKSLAVELAPHHIRVNCVAPGWIDNDLNKEVFKDRSFKKQIAESIPVKKIASNEDIAGVVLFLASHLADHITGEVINVNGGAVLCG
ncbi:MAG: SDR family NAD(P)-dependent oxidoreductase [bacterium]